MDSDEEDYVFIGTSLDGASAETCSSRRAAKPDNVPVWRQTVTDERGRARLHGAFTGGFSAGYYNSVGSKEGWAPATFTSSREARTHVQQSVEDYLDEDERAEMHKQALHNTAGYDTFGAAAAAEALQRARREVQQDHPSALPGATLAELVAPAADSVGMRLLQKMGWRRGKGVGKLDHEDEAGEDDQGGQSDLKEFHTEEQNRTHLPDDLEQGEEAPVVVEDLDTTIASVDDGPESEPSHPTRVRRRRWGAVGTARAENTALYLPQAKLDLYGLGYDPYKNFEDFRTIKQARLREQQSLGGGTRSRGNAFGVGVFEGADEDVFEHASTAREGLHFEVASSSDEEMEHVQTRNASTAKGATNPARLAGVAAVGDVKGFVRAAVQPEITRWYAPPEVPSDFKAMHHFSGPLLTVDKPAVQNLKSGRPERAPPPPPPAPPPSDAESRRAIETLAAFVARNGAQFEELARQRQSADPKFAFLFGGEGQTYYMWKLHELRQLASTLADPSERSRPLGLLSGHVTASSKLGPEDRRQLLGEDALPASEAPINSNASTSSARARVDGSTNQSLPPPPPAIAATDRDRLRAALNNNFTSPIDAESAPIAKPGLQAGKPKPKSAAELVAEMAGRFAPAASTSGADPSPLTSAEAFLATMKDTFAPASGASASKLEAQAEPAGTVRTEENRVRPTRTHTTWQPAPLLCKRFGVKDPFPNKDLEVVKRSKVDMLSLPDTAAARPTSFPQPKPSLQEGNPSYQSHSLPPAPMFLQAHKPPLQAQSSSQSSALPAPPLLLAASAPPQLVDPHMAKASDTGLIPSTEDAQDDSRQMADSFLNCLGEDLNAGVGGAPITMLPAPQLLTPAASATVPPGDNNKLEEDSSARGLLNEGMTKLDPAAAFLNKPIDLFKAIFENDDKEDLEQDYEDESHAEEARDSVASTSGQGVEGTIKWAIAPTSMHMSSDTRATHEDQSPENKKRKKLVKENKERSRKKRKHESKEKKKKHKSKSEKKYRKDSKSEKKSSRQKTKKIKKNTDSKGRKNDLSASTSTESESSTSSEDE